VLWLALRGFTPARNELPRHTATLPSFYVGRYPVTNAEYACFIEMGGYEDEHYWPTAAARAWLRGDNDGAAVQEWMKLWGIVQADTEKAIAKNTRLRCYATVA
jgi:formylglycine-generating enzyme required for sulfatase activity